MENLKIANMQAETEEKTASKPKRKYTRRTTSKIGRASCRERV